MTAPIEALARALEERGLHALPVFLPSLKDFEAQEFLQKALMELPPSVLINCTAFALSKAGQVYEPTILDQYDCPVLQAILSGSSKMAWQESPRGLSARDLAMHVVLPELDGRILSRAFAFKEEGALDERTQYRPVELVPHEDRIAFVAALAKGWARLRQSKPQERKLAVILANYPNKDSRIANGVGLDSPASVISLMSALRSEGYDIKDLPQDSDALMQMILSGPTNALGKATRLSESTLVVSAYKEMFETLPEAVRHGVEARWGQPENDPMVKAGAFQLAILTFGNLAVGVQPARGYNIDPRKPITTRIWCPPHNYFAFYFWLRKIHGMHAVIHAGKHGNLEWLPARLSR